MPPLPRWRLATAIGGTSKAFALASMVGWIWRTFAASFRSSLNSKAIPNRCPGWTAPYPRYRPGLRRSPRLAAALVRCVFQRASQHVPPCINAPHANAPPYSDTRDYHGQPAARPTPFPDVAAARNGRDSSYTARPPSPSIRRPRYNPAPARPAALPPPAPAAPDRHPPRPAPPRLPPAAPHPPEPALRPAVAAAAAGRCWPDRFGRIRPGSVR
jgi:hypothetical protein